MEFAEICIFSGQPIWSQCSLSMTSENEANVPFLYPLKTSEKHSFFYYFKGYGERPLTRNGFVT